MTATFFVGDAIEVMNRLPEKSVDLILTSPPFLALRSYLPSDHPDKGKEGGSQSTPGEFIDWLLDVVEACDRVLAPHGSLVFELGDTYSGSGGAGGDYSEGGLRERQEKFLGSGRMASGAKDAPQDSDGGYQAEQRVHYEGHRAGIRNMNQKIQPGGPAWPLAKSLSLIPETFRFAMVYGVNPHTGRQTEPWRLRNVIRWVRPNPPVGALGDKFRPATSELMVFCKSAKRFFDLDAVREPYKYPDHPQIGKDATGKKAEGRGNWSTFPTRQENPAGAPPLDWWKIPLSGVSQPAVGGFDSPPPGEGNTCVHLCPPDGEDAMPCCGKTPFQVSRWDRMTLDPDLVSCPPLDWWNIPLLEGEEPTKGGPKERVTHPEPNPNPKRKAERDLGVGGNGWLAEGDYHQRGGAPPLDWWNIPPGGYSGTVMWTARKPVDPRESVGDIWRTTSADCPVHADQSDQVPTAPHDEPVSEDRPGRSRGKGANPGPKPLPGSAPIDPLPLPSLVGGTSGSPLLESIPAAKRRSKASNKTAPAPATSPPDTASDRTPGRTDDTSTEPLSDGPHPDSPENRTSLACRDGCSPGNCAHNFDRSSEPFDEACTCSYWVAESQSTSHYAVWPPELCVKPVKAMCPEKVCRQCGEPSRRITDVSYTPHGDPERQHAEPKARADYALQQRSENPPAMIWGRATKHVETLGFSDCGHDDYRPGLVLDPFAGSGTTLAVATGHGRDAIGIDLDSRNFDLALERVGPFILSRAESV